MLEGLRALGIEALPWDDESRDLVARVEFVRGLGRRATLDDELAGLSDGAALQRSRLARAVSRGATRRAHLARVPLAAALRARLTPKQQRELDELAPTHVTLPTGTRAKIDYRDDNAPVASMRMQEVFGLAATPKIGGGARAGHVQAAVARRTGRYR